jgi:nucleoside-diphosphate-sugar epimerase
VRLVSVVGARGFVGSHLLRALAGQSDEVRILDRGAAPTGDLGVVVYCAGVTTDFRTYPYRTVLAHVSDLAPLLEKGHFQKLIYLSSTRVYGLAPADTHESASVSINPTDPDHLYNASKVLGESLIYASERPAHVLRLSNVVGVNPGNDGFLSLVVRAAVRGGPVTLNSALSSEKDYVPVHRVVEAILAVIDGRVSKRIYNVAAGVNTTHKEIMDALSLATGARIEVVPNAPETRYPRIQTESLARDMRWAPESAIDLLPALIHAYKGA